tara:strand:- start:64 stop:1050 length:987 start_codon:yes stop_codon:yes gene_type:complete
MAVPAGSIRFNTDSSKMEIYNGEKWWEIESFTGSGRGLFMGGSPSPDTIDYITIDSTGDAVDFGNLTAGRFTGGAFASQTRAVYVAGELNPSGNETNTIDYVTIASLGDAVDYGDLTTTRRYALVAVSNKTRGITGGGGTPTRVNTLDFFTISTTGNSSDFGDLTVARAATFSAQSAVRGIAAGGQTPSDTNVIDYFSMQSLGNAVDFGDLTVARANSGGGSNSTRAVFMGGTLTPSEPAGVNTIDYVQIMSTGNAVDFGDSTQARNGGQGGAAAPTRICQGGGNNPSSSDRIDFVNPQTTGDAVDFGNLSVARTYPFGTSNSHGGIG